MAKKILIGLVVVVVVFVGVGFLLPGDYEVTRSIEIAGTPQEIYEPVADLTRWPEWTVWNTEKYPDMKTEYDGAESGVGAKSSWTGETSGNGRMEITKADPNEGIEFTIQFEDVEPATGYVRFTQLDANHTRVTFGMKGSMGANPMARYMTLMMDGMMGAEFEQCLKGLKKLVESSRPAPPSGEFRKADDNEETKTEDKASDEKDG